MMFRILHSLVILTPIAAIGMIPVLEAAEERISGFSPEDTLTIRSADARMDEQPGIMHFDGNFELRASDWSLSSDQATLYGKLDDPETVVINGSPALILLNTNAGGEPSVINGRARQIVYRRNTNSILMEGEASLSRGEHTMSGEEIEYDIDTDRLRAGGPGGVRIRVEPEG